MFITTKEDGILEILTDIQTADDTVDIVIIDGVRFIREGKSEREEIAAIAAANHRNVSHAHNGCGCEACMCVRSLES